MGKNEWKRKRKVGVLEPGFNPIYIFCEGEKTEPNYFRGFKAIIEENPVYRNRIHIIPCACETIRVLEKAIQYQKDNSVTSGSMWLVYDKDSFPSKDFNEVETRVKSLNKKNPHVTYHACWSNECFELWLLLHFSYMNSNISREDYVKKLNVIFHKKDLDRYEKNRKDIFTIVEQYGNPGNAIKYSKKLLENTSGKTPSEIAPGTKVYELVEELARYLPEERKRI